MENAWPLWALPFWTMGVPLIWAVIEKIRTPKFHREVQPDVRHEVRQSSVHPHSRDGSLMPA